MPFPWKYHWARRLATCGDHPALKPSNVLVVQVGRALPKRSIPEEAPLDEHLLQRAVPPIPTRRLALSGSTPGLYRQTNQQANRNLRMHHRGSSYHAGVPCSERKEAKTMRGLSSLSLSLFLKKTQGFSFFWTPQRAQVEGDLVRRRRSVRRGVKVGELRREEAAAVSLEEERRVVYKVRRK